jgi:phosphoglycerate dehydrogenase-like enzyme
VEEFRERGALWGRRLGIVGFGYTGREMARIGRSLGMHVTVLRRISGASSPDVDVMLSTEAGDGLDLILESDIVMLAASLSDQTYHLFSTEQFCRMKKTSIIVNMARGSVIDEKALIEALKAGEIAGAGLDVFETEPLPAHSPLWDLPNVLVTPHSTPQMPDKTQRSINVIVENINHYREGLPMLNVIDERDLFTKGL